MTLTGNAKWLVRAGLLLAALSHDPAHPQADRLPQGVAPQSAPARTTTPNEQSSSSPAGTSIRPVLDRYCVTCHNARLKTAGLQLDAIDPDRISGANIETWEKVARKLRTREMPPAGLPRPDAARYERATAALEAALDRSRGASPNPGRVIGSPPEPDRIRQCGSRSARPRRSTAERCCPPTNRSAGLRQHRRACCRCRPRLLENYLSAAAKVSRLAIGDPRSTRSVEHVQDSHGADAGRTGERRSAVRIARRHCRCAITFRSTANTASRCGCSGSSICISSAWANRTRSTCGSTAC